MLDMARQDKAKVSVMRLRLFLFFIKIYNFVRKFTISFPQNDVQIG